MSIVVELLVCIGAMFASMLILTTAGMLIMKIFD